MGKAAEKIERVYRSLEHEEPDRVPLGEFFWSSFLARAKEVLSPDRDFDPYRYWDLDLVVVNPNMDPHVTGVQVLERTDERIVVRTGFGATAFIGPRMPPFSTACR